MALPTGLVPVLVCILTVGVAAPVTLGAHLFHRGGRRPFAAALRTALLAAGGAYLLGVAGVWAVAGGVPVWEVAAALLLAGVAASVVLTGLPLLVGRWIVLRWGALDPDAALRFTAYGWALTMLVVFGLFVAPGGVAGGDLLDLGGERVCLVGFCGVAVRLVAAALLELFVAVLGPGVTGLALHSLAVRARPHDTSSGL